MKRSVPDVSNFFNNSTGETSLQKNKCGRPPFVYLVQKEGPGYFFFKKGDSPYLSLNKD
jgi:hypothetical protein